MTGQLSRDFAFPSPGPFPGVLDQLDGKVNAPVDTTQAALAAIANAINTTGKARHKLVVDENERVYRALGSTAGSGWQPLDDPSALGTVTPA